MDFCCQADAAAFLSHVNQNALAFLLDLPQGRVQLISAVTSARSENVAGETLAVHAHQRRFVLEDLAFHEREMMLAVELGAIQMQIEITVIRRHFHDLLQLDQFLALAPVSDQTLEDRKSTRLNSSHLGI